MIEWFVEIVSYETLRPVKTRGPFATEQKADRIERGVGINLDHAKFFTVVKRVSA